jgi:hypothetical protein
MNWAVWLIVASAVAAPRGMASQRIIGSPDLNRRIVLGDLDDALMEYDSLAAYYRKAAATDSAMHGTFRDVYLREAALFMFDKAQVVVLQGDHEGAARLFVEAGDFVASHLAASGPHAVGTDLAAVADATRGFIAENTGDLEAARVAYEKARSEAARGRLALLALKQGHTDEARALAQQDTLNPTSQLVLGTLAEQARNFARACLWYERAGLRVDVTMNRGADPELMPMYFRESAAIEEARTRIRRQKGACRPPADGGGQAG